jgi:predicted Zn-dependent protease
MLGEAQCLELLSAALAACEGDQAEAMLYRTNSALTRFAESRIHQNVAELSTLISVRAILGKRIGCARGNQLAVAEVQSVARRALDLARVAAEDGAFVSLPGPESLPSVASYAEATASSSPERRARAARTIVGIAERDGCEASGSLSAEASELAVANSLGVRAYAPATQASLVLVVNEEESSGYADWRGMDISRVEPGAAAEKAAEKCLAGRGAESIAPGEYPVVLEPAAVGDLIMFLGYLGLGALSLQEGRSFLTDRLGEKVMGENITIWDDATDPRGLAIAFDWEGQPKRKVVLIEHGVARQVVYDSYTASREGKKTTGHALPAPNTAGPLPLSLFLAPGEASLDEMIASTDRGLLVTRFHYVNVVHEKQTIITGMTRDGTFLIEHGRLTRPVKNLRFTQSIVEAFNRVEMIGRECQLGDYAYVPALKIGKFAFTSQQP